MDLTREFIDICNSFKTSVITDEQVARFKELVNEEKVDVLDALEREQGINPLFLLLYYFPDHPKLIELVELLILKGVNIEDQTLTSDYDYWTPLNALSKNDRLSDQLKIDLMELIFLNPMDKYQVDGIKDKYGRTALHNFCRYCKNDNLVDIIQFLLSHCTHGDLASTARDFQGNTPLHELCRHYNKGNLADVAEFLVQEGAGVNEKNNDLETPFYFLFLNQTENKSLIDMIRIFIEEFGADVNADCAKQSGYTPLHALCENYKNQHLIMDIVNLMEEEGADVNASNYYDGKTPLSILRSRGFLL